MRRSFFSWCLRARGILCDDLSPGGEDVSEGGCGGNEKKVEGEGEGEGGDEPVGLADKKILGIGLLERWICRVEWVCLGVRGDCGWLGVGRCGGRWVCLVVW